MTITVKLFAILRDLAGASEMIREIPPGITVQEVSISLSRQTAGMGKYLSKLAYAVNEQIVPAHTELHDGDVLALIPPVSGG